MIADDADAVAVALLAIMDRPRTGRSPQRESTRPHVPASLSGSERPGGGDPLGDYLHLKGERQ